MLLKRLNLSYNLLWSKKPCFIRRPPNFSLQIHPIASVRYATFGYFAIFSAAGAVARAVLIVKCKTLDSTTLSSKNNNEDINKRKLLTESNSKKTLGAVNEQKSKEEVIIQTADRMYEAVQQCPSYQQLYAYLSQYSHSSNAEVLWRIAAAAYLAANDLSSRNENGMKMKMMKEGLEHARKAVEADAKSAGAHRWYAILLSHTTQLDGFYSYLCQANAVKEHLEHAIRLKADDHAAYFLLGNWHHYYADFDTLMRFFCTLLFVKSPKEASYEEALRCFLKVEELRPGESTANLWLIADTYRSLQQYDKMLIYLRRLVHSPIRNIDDRLRQEHAQNLLNEFKEK